VVYACLLNIILNVLLVPRLGLQGAAVATLVSYLFMVLLMAQQSFRLLPLEISYRGFAANLVAGTIAFVIVRFIQFQHPIANVLTKSAAAFFLYVPLVLLLNPVLRQAALSLRRVAGKPASAELAVN
jgi:O-antigen/teichoic acid export membrane protein